MITVSMNLESIDFHNGILGLVAQHVNHILVKDDAIIISVQPNL